ncbi:Calcium-transporting ATPase 1 [Penicillium atrosanguineum]|nr:Calcium-transporting ATPase 1 [Penicillium atrosanguineum]
MSRSTTPALPLHNAHAEFPRPSPANPLGARLDAPSSTSTSTYSWLEPHETAERLQTSLQYGLTPAEAEIRLARDGPNELPHEEPEPLWLRFLKQFKETLILLLLASAGISFLMGNLDDALSITLAVTIVVSVGFVQEYRSEKSLEALSRLVPHYAHLIRHLPGTNAGDRIPADIRITSATDLSIDESNLTGENEPVVKFSAALRSHSGKVHALRGTTPPRSPFYDAPATGAVGADIRLNEQHNIAFMGTLVRSGYGQGIVISTGAKTEFGAISASLQEIESPRTPLQLSMDRLGQELSWVSFGVIGLIMFIGLLQGRKVLEMFTISVSLAVAAIPEGLPIIVTVTLALGVLTMAKRGAIMRRLPSVETLGSVNVVCSDKTGTLTLNHMTITKMWHFDSTEPFEVQRDMTGVLRPAPPPALSFELETLRTILDSPARMLTHPRLPPPLRNSTAVKSRWVGQPTDVAILDLLDSLGEDDVRDRISGRVSETPFSSERKWMGVIIGSGSPVDSNVAYIKGALEQVLARSDTYLTKDGREVILDEPRRQMIRDAAEQMASEGLRVLAFASGAVRDSSRGMRGFGSRSGTPTSNSSSPSNDDDRYNGLSIRRLMSGGVRVIMITGDAETTAVAIAKKLGMPVSEAPGSRSVISGRELDHMSTAELSQAISTTSIFARTSPDHKMKIVKALQARGDVVAMTGDGVNDAPALKKADIGISMGKLGTDVAKEAADMILTDDDFSTILRAIEQGKGIFYNIQNFVTFQLSTSVAALSLVLVSTTLGFENPLNAMQILWINILMDGPPAQSLGVEPVDPSIMNRPPRPKTARVLTRPLVQRVLTSALVIMLGTLAVEGKSILRGEISLFGNKMFNYCVLGSLAGQACVIYLPFLQRVFQTEPLSLGSIFKLFLLASSVFWVDEGRKYLSALRRQRGLGAGYSANV